MICPLCNQTAQLMGPEGSRRFTIHGDCPGGFARLDLVDTRLESRYTDPRPDCPHPERWHSDDWDSAEHEVSELVAMFVAALRPDYVLETGAAFGQTAYSIGTVLLAAGVGQLHTIEIDPERADITRKRCEGLPVVVEQMSSMSYTPPGGVGFAWFDSMPELRVPEFRRFYPQMAPGALVAFHDTAPHHGVQIWHDILGLEEEGLLLPIRLRTPRGVVVGEVTGNGN
jgi:hypothetical protein